VTFQDGTPFNAEAVKFSFDRMNELGLGPSFVLTGVYDHVEIEDDYNCTIVLSKPSNPFLGGLPKVFTISPELVMAHATSDDPWASTWVRENWGAGGGTGPFKLASWVRGQEIVLERNSDYWDPERPRVDTVVIREVPEYATQRILLEGNEIDHYYPSPDDIGALQSNANVKVELRDAIIELYIQVSQVEPPLDNLKVREAVARAFDYQGFIEGPYENLAIQAQGPIASAIPFHDPSIEMLQRDLDGAKQKLAEAGFPDGGLELEYVHVQGDQPELAAGLILQEGLAELGIELTMVELAWPQMVERMQNPDALMQVYGYYRFPPIAHPDAYFVGLWHTSNQLKGYNGTMYGTPETDQMMEEARSTVDEKVAADLYGDLQHKLFDDVAAMFLANPKSLAAFSARVENYLYTPTWHSTLNLDSIGVAGQ
jgi:peptide/nickel transport system substrate-binding protein